MIKNIQTYETKKLINPLMLKLEDIDIKDIALALSHECRFNGHCRPWYSVAEHSIYVAKYLPKELQLAGLLHDAAEAYLKDIPKPIKNQIPEYKFIEDQIQDKIYQKFGIYYIDKLLIKNADNIVLWNEVQKLKSNFNIYKNQIIDIDFEIEINIRCETALVIEYKFLKLFKNLYKQ